MHGVQEKTELSRKVNGRKCLSSIEECAEQQHSESIVEQNATKQASNKGSSEAKQIKALYQPHTRVWA